MQYTREELIKICEQAFVPQNKWHNRDSSSAQIHLGECYALLKAGCHFEMNQDGPKPDDQTIWIQFFVKDFLWFEGSQETEFGNKSNSQEDYLYYLPTQKRLDKANGQDWY